MLLASLILILVVEPTQITRWDDPTPITAASVEISEQGVQIRREDNQPPELIAWYQIRSIEPSPASRFDNNQVSLDTWRAHARVRRGDYSGALPIYERLGERFLWKHGPQSADVSAGLVQCWLDQHQRSKAITAMFAWYVATEQRPVAGNEQTTETQGGQGAIHELAVDPVYRLLLDLPPVYLPDDRLAMLELLPGDIETSARTQLLVLYFQIAQSASLDAQMQLRLEQLRREIRGRDQGLELVADMVMASYHPDPSKRQAARDALQRRARAEQGGWREVWARLGLGSAMLQDEDPLVNEQGAIELMHITVRLGELRPVLTRLAATMLQNYFNKTGRPQWGAKIMNDALRHRSIGVPERLPEEHSTDG